MWRKILYSCELYAVSMQLFSDDRTFIENKSLFLCGQKNLTSTYLHGWQEILGIGTLSAEAKVTISIKKIYINIIVRYILFSGILSV